MKPTISSVITLSQPSISTTPTAKKLKDNLLQPNLPVGHRLDHPNRDHIHYSCTSRKSQHVLAHVARRRKRTQVNQDKRGYQKRSQRRQRKDVPIRRATRSAHMVIPVGQILMHMQAKRKVTTRLCGKFLVSHEF